MIIFWEIVKVIIFFSFSLFVSFLWYWTGWNDGFEYYKKELENRRRKKNDRSNNGTNV